MELNRAQLLVHDDTALNKFRIDHSIPKDIQIEHFEPNEDAPSREQRGPYPSSYLADPSGRILISHQPDTEVVEEGTGYTLLQG
ncbi:hypothetical protein Acr_26g0000960 [Actinidia rufa]|uniref:Uncharacterized protein n=1 Tax=Actinidia rufa TaxID=165716 RepID=A0A7J0H172_9ERIC|nr:hypothetical protein Acr_26g0000960 [Actinidia rufa]